MYEELTKRCGRCDERLPLDAFNRLRDGRQHWCRECFRAYFRERGVVHRRQSARARRKRVAAARALVKRHLEQHPCVDCGERDLRVLDFDHLHDKSECVGALAGWGAPPERIVAEVARCEVRCANCHRRVTALRAGWSRVMGNVDDRGAPSPPRSVATSGTCTECSPRRVARIAARPT